MPTMIKYPKRILQHGGREFAHFANIDYAKVNDYRKSVSSIITGRSGSTPQIGWLQCDYFGFDLPVGAEVVKIQFVMEWYKTDAVEGRQFNLPGPKIELEGLGIPKFPSNAVCDERESTPPVYGLGAASIDFDGNYTLYYPLSEIEKHPETPVDGWNGSRTARTYHGTYSLPSRELINSNFTAIITFPKNVGGTSGYIGLRSIYIRVWYKEPSYSLQLEKVGTSDVYVGIPSDFKITLNNINLVNYVTSVKITLPPGATVDRYQGIGDSGGTVNITGNEVTWIPPQSNKRANYSLLLSVKFAKDESISITAVEQFMNISKSVNLTVYPTPTGIVSEEIDSGNIIYAKTDINFKLPIKIPVSMLENYSQIYFIPDTLLELKQNNTWVSVAANEAYAIPISSFNEEGYYELTCRTSNEGIIYIGISTSTIAESNTFIVKVIDDALTTPRVSVIQLKEEEINRLGDGFTYMVNSQLKLSCEVSKIGYFKDYYRNFRIGVVNSIPETLDATAIFEACRNWSDGLDAFNVFLDRSVEFSFDENYPVYIVLVGDYVDERDYFSLLFTHPILLESETYSGYDTTTYLPEPILNVLNDDIDYAAELNLDPYLTSNPIRVYDFPFSEGFGTDDYHAIQGIEVVCQLSCESQLVVFARLKSPNGEVGVRSAVLNTGDNLLSIGGEFDTWGFGIQELTNLSDWELELEIQNIFENHSPIKVLFENIYIIAHFLDIKQNRYNVFVDGENMRLHGMFLKKVDPNPGIKSKTQYVSVEGSDSHDPMSMNIDLKEIELEFNVRGCTIEETTKLLREITRIFTNNRDELNRPIPKRVEFTHIPGYHWDYILEDTIDANVKTAGYDSKIKLKIFDGTSWANSDIITNTIGVNESIAKVSPQIQLIPLSETVEITETIHNQKFTITNPNFTPSDSVVIDCADKKVYLNGDTPITNLADWDVDWFVLYPGEFRFDDNGTCIIQNVIYTPRGV